MVSFRAPATDAFKTGAAPKRAATSRIAGILRCMAERRPAFSLTGEPRASHARAIEERTSSRAFVRDAHGRTFAECIDMRIWSPAVGSLFILVASCSSAPPEDEVSAANALAANVFRTGTQGLNVRARPSVSSPVVASLGAGMSVDIECQIAGDSVLGTSVWNYLPAYGGYASDAYLWTGYDGFAPSLPRCGATNGTTTTEAGSQSPGSGYALPLSCGTSATISQGNGSAFSHVGAAYYGFDFAVPRGTPLVAMNDGVVSLANGSVGPGQACFSGGGPECANTLNYVVVQHADGTDTAYLHADAILVAPGARVRRGDRVALSGGTGWSTGPHAHVQRQQRCGSWWCQSVGLSFVDVPGGVPSAGQSVTSRNCR